MVNKSAWRKWRNAGIIVFIIFAIVGNSNVWNTVPRSILKFVDISFNLLVFGLFWLAIVCREKELQLFNSSAYNAKIKILKVLKVIIPILLIFTTVTKIFS